MWLRDHETGSVINENIKKKKCSAFWFHYLIRSNLIYPWSSITTQDEFFFNYNFLTVHTKKEIQTVLIITKLVFVKAWTHDKKETRKTVFTETFFTSSALPQSLIPPFECEHCSYSHSFSLSHSYLKQADSGA